MDQFPLVDGGVPAAAQAAGLGARFHYWCGASGRRYLFTAVSPGGLADFHDVVVVIARRDGEVLAGLSIALLGSDADPERRLVAEMLAADRRLCAFIHLLAPTAAHRRSVIDDLIGRRMVRDLAA